MGGAAVSIADAILDGARALVSQLLDLVDADTAQELLTAEAVRRDGEPRR